MRYYFNLYLIVCYLFLSEGVSGQNYAKIIPEGELFSSEEGLSSTRINVSFIDSRNFLWLGTSDGLNRYDGYEFRIFRHHPGDSLSISDSFIRCISEDDEGNLWLGTNEGLNKFNRKTGSFEPLLLWENDSLRENTQRIDAILVEDSLTIWIKTNSYLERINCQTNEVKSFRFNEDAPINYSGQINSGLIKDGKSHIWFGSNKGLYSFDIQKEKFILHQKNKDKIYSISDNVILSVISDRNGELWIGTNDGLNKYDRLKKRFIRYLPEGNEQFAIRSIFEDIDGRLWLATETGYAIFNKRNEKFSLHNKFLSNTLINPLFSLNTMVIDPFRIMWAGGLRGLIKIDLKPKKFELYNTEINSRAKLESDNVSAVYKDIDEKIWLGYYSEGLSVIDPVNNSVKNYSTSNASISDDYIRCFYEDKKNRMWIGTNTGLDVYPFEKKEFFHFWDYFQPVSSSKFKNISVNVILEDERGVLWIGTSNGLFEYKENINTLNHYYKVYNRKKSSELGEILSLCQVAEKELWIGTDKGIIVFNTQTNIFYKPDFGFDLNTGFQKSSVFSILKAHDSLIWMGTNYGLFNFNQELGKGEFYNEEKGLLNNFIFKILEDINLNIWISTNKGISKFDNESNEFVNFGVHEGLQAYEYNPSCGFSAMDGELFFGGIKGLNSFYPDQLQEFGILPQIQITSIEINGKNKTRTFFIDKSFANVNVRYNQSINVHFSAMDFSFPEKNKYMYSLTEIGKKEIWHSIGSSHMLSFSNLNSGEFIFKVKGASGSGTWNQKDASIRIIVEAPFWKTRVARISFGLVIFMIFYFLIQYRTQALRHSNKILRENDRVAQEVLKQKNLLTKRNKNIEDSINYAHRIQSAMLTTPRMFKQILPLSFILHKPKDIVSGDFYWISEMGDKVFVAAIDCTGHGVPGAFMSLIGFELFRKIINMQGVEDPGLILNYLNDNFQEIFGKEHDIALRDGMDLAFCVINKKEMVLDFAGAFNPLYIIRENKLIEIKGDRFSVGADDESVSPVKKEFLSQRLKLEKNDMLYMFSDGYADQFGGPEGKKYKYRRFRHLLLTIHELSLTAQRQYLEDNIEEWRGSIEQIDDILVIGIKADF